MKKNKYKARNDIGIGDDILLRFISKIIFIPNGCWNWCGTKSSSGYGVITANKKQLRAHRLSLLFSGKNFKDGFQVDHLCRNIICVNPSHLEIVTSRENTLRGIGPSAMNSKKRFCHNGHIFDVKNTRLRNGRRECRPCCAQREMSRKNRIEQMAEYESTP